MLEQALIHAKRIILTRRNPYQLMIAFIALLSEVQVMCDFVRFVGHGCEFNFHVKLTPTFLLNAERRLFEDCRIASSASGVPGSKSNHRLSGLEVAPVLILITGNPQ